MEQLLREQQAGLEKLLADQQQSVQRLFIDHQEAMQRFLTNVPQRQLPPPTPSQEKAPSAPHAAPRPELCGLLKKKSGALTDDSSEESSDEDLVTRHATSPTLSKHSNRIQKCLLPITMSNIFKGFMTGAIILNTIFLGYRTHLEMRDTLRHLEKDNPSDAGFDTYPTLNIIAKAFFSLFTVEMIIRIIAEQGQFCCGPSKYWNAFELICLASMAMEQLPMEDAKYVLGNFATLRLFRLLRILRAARAVRLIAYMKHLRIMLYSVVSCLVSMFWAIMLLLLIICLYALYLEDTSVSYLREKHELVKNSTFDAAEFNEVKEQLSANWNGMSYAVVSLIYSISGGADWGDLAEPFWTMRGGVGMSYMFFVILTIFGLLNVLVGIFVQEAEEISKWDKDFVVDGFVTKRKEKEEAMTSLFDDMDTGKDGELSLTEMSDALGNDAIAAQLAHHGIEVEKASVLFHVLDADGNEKITKTEFVQGLTKLHGSVNATQVADQILEEKKMASQIFLLKEYIGQRIDSLQDKLVAPGSSGVARPT